MDMLVDDGAIGYLPRKLYIMRDLWVAGSKGGMVRPSRTFDIRDGAVGFEICPARFYSCFGLVCLHYVFFGMPFGMVMCHFMLEVCNLLFNLIRSYNLKISLVSKGTLDC